jgi:PadR family transcriptional regulator, regulatory protein PadR
MKTHGRRVAHAGVTSGERYPDLMPVGHHANIVDSMPPDSPLGEFEITVLLAVLSLDDDSSGARVLEEIASRTGRMVARGSVYVTLDRLQDKKLVTSRTDRATPERGGHPRRTFKVTPAGLDHLRRSLQMIDKMTAGLEPLLNRS